METGNLQSNCCKISVKKGVNTLKTKQVKQQWFREKDQVKARSEKSERNSEKIKSGAGMVGKEFY